MSETIKVDLKNGPKVNTDNVTKVDLSKPIEVITPEEEVITEDTAAAVEEVAADSEEVININEVTEPAVIAEVEKIIESTPKANLPENVEKLVDFMQETGGTVQDYVRLNADYDKVDSDTLLREYYKNTKSHLDSEEIDFLMEDKFDFDEDIDEERDIRKKKLAKKEKVAEAKNFLEGLKDKYYSEIKLRPGVSPEQNEASEFFNRYNENQKIAEQQHSTFKESTKQMFNQDFKGFDFKLGDKTFRYGVQNVEKVAENQSNINNLIGKFLNEKGEVTDTKGYHKAIYAASNADTIAKHFYEQGKADAVKDVVAKSKNVSSEASAVDCAV